MRPGRRKGLDRGGIILEVSDACIQCGICAEACPVGAIDPNHSEDNETGLGQGRVHEAAYPVLGANGAGMLSIMASALRESPFYFFL